MIILLYTDILNTVGKGTDVLIDSSGSMGFHTQISTSNFKQANFQVQWIIQCWNTQSMHVLM